MNNNEYNEEEKKIMKKIREESENIEIPESLKPDNMMKKIKENQLNSSYKERKKSNIFGMALAAAGIILVVTAGMGINSLQRKKNTEYVKKTTVKYGLQEQIKLEVGESKNAVSNLGTKEEISDLFVKHYENADDNGHLDTDMIINGAENETDWSDGESNQNDNISELPAGNDESKVTISDETGFKPDSMENETLAETMPDANVNNEYVENTDYYRSDGQISENIEGDVVLTDGKYIYTSYDNKINIVETAGANLDKAAVIDIMDDLKKYDCDSSYILDMYIKNNKLIVITYIDAKGEDSYNGYGMEYEKQDIRDLLIGRTVVMQYDVSDKEKPKHMKNVEIEGEYDSSRLVGNYLHLITVRDCIIGDYSNYEDIINETCMPKVDGKEIGLDKIYGSNEEGSVDSYVIITAIDCSDKLKVNDKSAVMINNGKVYVNQNNIYIFQDVYDYVKKEAGDSTVVYDKVKRDNNTLIYKFKYNKGKINPVASSMIEGNVLNEFWLDEYNGYLRIVSSVKNWDKDNDGIITTYDYTVSQTVHLLDDELKRVGYLEGIAEEKYVDLVKLMGNKIYFIKYGRNDEQELFVVDVSAPENPVFVDGLKVPEYSEYMQPWEKGLLFGIDEEHYDGISTGIKLSMLDTTTGDFELRSKKVIENTLYAYLYNYNFVMTDAKKNLIGFTAASKESDYKYYLFKYEAGEFVELFSYINKDDENWYRSLYIEDYLYIISDYAGIQAVSLDDFSYGDYCSLS